MSEHARVDSIEAIKQFRRALFKFAEAANVAIGDAESEAQRVLIWLESEQSTYWAGELRKRTEMVARCKEAVRMKKLFKDSSGRTPSAIDEEKALQAALRRLQEAEEKVVAVKRYTQKLQKELLLYKGHIQRFATTLQHGVPTTAAKIDAMVEKLEQYVALSAPTSDLSAGSLGAPDSSGFTPASELQSIRRPEPIETPPKVADNSQASSAKPADSGE